MDIANILRGIAGAVLVAAAPAEAASFTWPSPTAPCNGTLQACIDAAPAPSIIFIAADSVTNTGHSGSSISLSRSISLTAASGFAPTFPAGVGILSAPAAPVEIGISRITLRGADVRLLSAGGSYHIEGMRLFDSTIDLDTIGTAPTSLQVIDSEYLRSGGAGNFIRASTVDAPLSGRISFNRVNIPDTDSSAYGIVVSSAGSAGFDFTIAHNEIRSGFAYGGICGLSNTTGGAGGASTLRVHGNVMVSRRPGIGRAVCVFAGEGAIDARITHNTIVGFNTAIGMSVRPFSPPPAAQPITGFVIGNLFAHNGSAFRRDAVAATPGDAVSNGQNLFFDNTTNFGGDAPATAGSGTINADPRLVSLQNPYLTAGSPAIGAGNPLALPAGFTQLDADGSRRLKNIPGGGGNVIDIGAYEYGDDWFEARATAATTTGNVQRIAHPSIDGEANARVHATPNFSNGSITHRLPYGVFYGTGTMQWSLFNQNNAIDMPIGAGYSVFAAAPGTGSFLHQLPASGATTAESVIEQSAVNELPDQIVIATQNWNPGTAFGVYNDHPVQVAYAGDRWRVRNADGAVLPNSAAFNIYAQPPSISAFRVVADAGNTVSGSLEIDHPRLNGFRCAELVATPLASFGDRTFDLEYHATSQRWRIVPSSAMPAGAAFNVVFSPRQIRHCGGTMFAGGFE